MLALLIAQVTMIVPVPCSEREGIVFLLMSTYHEQQIATGSVPSGEVIEVWYNIDTGTMTILRTYANGLSCIQAVAEDIEFIGSIGDGL